jgi:hypothetical protein
MVLFNFYLHVLIYYQFTALFEIFYHPYTSANLFVGNDSELDQSTEVGASPVTNKEQ